MGTAREARSEAENWLRAVSGDADAFAAVFDLHRDRVFGHSLRLVRSPPDAEDLTALVFFEAWRRRGNVRLVDGSIIGWLLVTANFVVRNHERTQRRHRALLAKLPQPEPGEDHADRVLQGLELAARRANTRAAFAQLGPRDQDVLTLCVLEEWTMTQAGRALEIPVGTVKSRLSRAKQRFAALLKSAAGMQPTSADAELNTAEGSTR